MGVRVGLGGRRKVRVDGREKRGFEHARSFENKRRGEVKKEGKSQNQKKRIGRSRKKWR